MQIRQRQARFKHASETDNKLFFPESVMCQCILAVLIMRNQNTT